MVLREFTRTIYHEVEIHESGAFEVSVKPILVLSLASLNPLSQVPSAQRLLPSVRPSAIRPELLPFTERTRLSSLDKSLPEKVQN
jgi:hypothetical protein